jgi:transcriptional regulator with XRE-family HTH domain
MNPITRQQFASLRHELGMTGEQFGRLFGFGAGAKTRVSRIESGAENISRHVNTIYRLLVFLREHGLLEKFISASI